MGFWSEAWDRAKSVGRGVADVFVGVVAVLVLTVYAIGVAIFSIVKHLYAWIDKLVSKFKCRKGTAIILPPKETGEFLNGLKNERAVLPDYTPNSSLLVATNDKGEVITAQVASPDEGYERTIDEFFKKGMIVEQPFVL